MAKHDRRLATVTYANDADGVSHVFQPGTLESEIPEGVIIDNESAWVTPLDEEEMEALGLDHAPGEYSELSAKELTQLVNDRGLESKSTAKAELIKVLEEADEAANGASVQQ